MTFSVTQSCMLHSQLCVVFSLPISGCCARALYPLPRPGAERQPLAAPIPTKKQRLG